MKKQLKEKHQMINKNKVWLKNQFKINFHLQKKDKKHTKMQLNSWKIKSH
jgi:hypothetical protein